MRRNTIFLITCAIILLLPVLFFNWKPDQVSVTENRMLAEPVSLKSGITTYMKSLDNCANDRIGFRDNLVRTYRNMMVHVFRDGGEQVTIGKDGWLFYNEDIPDYTGTNIDMNLIDYQVSILREISNWCQQRNITFVFMVGPNKSTIYSEYMPSYIQQAEVTRLDILLDKLNQAGVLTVCPKEKLLQHKKSEELYYKLDTHWNSLGAQYAFKELNDKVNLPKKNFNVNLSRIEHGDLKNMLGVANYPSNSLEATVEKEADAWIESIPDSKDLIIHSDGKPKFICYRDSFSTALIDYYTHYFSGPMYWNPKIDFDYVEKEKPEFLILETVERGIGCWGVIEYNIDIMERQ